MMTWTMSTTRLASDDAQRPEEHRPEDERHVGGHDRIDRELADPRPREDPLDDHDAAEEEPEVEPDLAQDRTERVAERVAATGPVGSPTPLECAVPT